MSNNIGTPVCLFIPSGIPLKCPTSDVVKGNIVDYDIFPSYIKSKKKMTYSKVNDIIMRDIVDPEYTEYADTLKQMNNLAHILRENKVRRGYIDFDLDEAKVKIPFPQIEVHHGKQ